MLGAVLHYGPADPSVAWKIEKALRTLEAKWNVVGGPNDKQEFAEAEMGDCTGKNSCFGDSRGGIPSISIGAVEAHACGMPMAGQLDFGPGEVRGTVAFRYQMRQNECPGTTEFEWDFGDGTKQTTRQGQVSHNYARPGAYTVKAMPRCVRTTSICEARAQSTQVNVGK
jgi:hypothetical protein